VSDYQRYIAITCEALARSIYAAAASSPHTVTVRLFQQGLHNTPKNLRVTLQDEIDKIQPDECDAILLAYGLCGLSTLGLHSHHLPLIIPRAHDCISLYLGSRERYSEEFNAHPGTYWYSLDYMERNQDDTTVALGASFQAPLKDVYDSYVEKYGKENADYLMEVMGAWRDHYSRAVFIRMGFAEEEHIERRARAEAERRGWSFERLQGNPRLLNLLLHGDWPTEEFLLVPPGHSIQQSPDPEVIIRAEPLLRRNRVS
jgi:hypothetical protein